MVRLARRFITFAVLVLPLCAVALQAAAQHRDRPMRVLLLFQQQGETLPMVEFAQQFRLTVRESLGSPVEFYQESLDFDRFTGRENSSPLVAYFDEKYRGLGIDVVVPVGSRALRFATNHLREVIPGVPIVFGLCAAPQVDPSTLPANVTGRLARASRFVLTLSMARRLQPEARRVVVIGGAGPADSVAVAAAVTAVAAAGDSLQLSVLQGLPLDSLLQKNRQLPKDAIVIFANYRYDGHGQAFEPLDIVGSIARASAAPMYTQLESYVGEGVVGGSVTKFDDEGARTARLLVRVLRRRPGEGMPPVEPITNGFVADWRQLRRWALSEQRLPPGTELVFREATPWQRYRTSILLALGVIAAELVLIGLLLIERRRRKRAQAMVEEQQRQTEETLRQVAHMGRVALVGELAATISHEVRQPLAAIRVNAETGVKIATRRSGQFMIEERQLCEEIFADILADDERASEIISRVRALLRREEGPQKIVDLNEVCRVSTRLLGHDALSRRAEIVLSLDPRLPAVTGDFVQLQQVVMNLVMNALDASMPASRPRVEIRTVARQTEVEVVVRDNGPGISAEVQRHLFESFFTTKAQGLGLGLVIVRSIVDRHAGRVHVENGEAGGAVVRVVLARASCARGDPTEARRLEVETTVSV